MRFAKNQVYLAVLTASFIFLGCAEQGEVTKLNAQDDQHVSMLSKELRENIEDDRLAAVLTITAWVHSSLAPIEDLTPKDPNEAIELLVGACGDRDLVVQNVLNKLGFITRRVSFFDVPVQIGHTATEVFVGGKWRFIDASTGLYFANPADLSVPLSLAEARAIAPNVQAMQSTLDPWQKKWIEMSEVSDRYKAGTLYSVNNANIFYHPLDPSRVVFYLKETYLDSAYTNFSHPKVRFNIPIDLNASSFGSIGADDSSSSDLIGPFFSINGNSFYNSALWFLGTYFEIPSKGIKSPVHRFLFSSSQNKTVTLKLHFQSYSSDMPNRLTIAGAAVRRITWSGATVAISVDVSAAQTTIEVSMLAGTPALHTLDYISWH